MLAVCPKCEKVHETARARKGARINCGCGEIIETLPWKQYKQVISRLNGGACPYCSRKYAINQYPDQTEIACSCGNVLFVFNDKPTEAQEVKLKSDKTIRLLEKELLGLIDTARLLHSSTQNLDKLMEMTVEITTRMLDVEGCSVVVRNREKGKVVLYSLSGNAPSSLSGFEVDDNDHFIGRSVDNRTTFVDNQVGRDPTAFGPISPGGFKTKSLLCVPLVVEGQNLGELELVNKKSPEGFTQHDVILAESVASQIAVAIQNVQLAAKALKTERRAAMGEAVSGVAHCVKNMLNGLHGGMYVVKSDIKRAGVDVSDTGFELMERNIARLTELVQDMLSTAADRKLEMKLTDANELARSVSDLMKAKAGQLGLNILFVPSPGLEHVNIDAKGIYRAVLNLVSNALDASTGHKGSTISIKTESVSEEYFSISVADQGCGMDAETLKSIFKPFFTSKGIEGTGLGLSVTKKLVDDHDGRIDVISEPGQGTTFTIILPKNITHSKKTNQEE